MEEKGGYPSKSQTYRAKGEENQHVLTNLVFLEIFGFSQTYLHVIHIKYTVIISYERITQNPVLRLIIKVVNTHMQFTLISVLSHVIYGSYYECLVCGIIVFKVYGNVREQCVDVPLRTLAHRPRNFLRITFHTVII